MRASPLIFVRCACALPHDHHGTHHERIPNGLTTSLKKPRSDSFDSKRKPGSFSGRLQDVARLLLARLQVLSSFRFNRPERCRVLCPNDTCDRCVISVICFACRAIGIPAIISRYCHPINSDAMSSAPPPPCARICQFSFFGSIPWNRRRLFRHTSHRSPVHRPDVCCWYLCQTYHEFEWHRPLGSCGPVPPATFALPRKRPL